MNHQAETNAGDTPPRPAGRIVSTTEEVFIRLSHHYAEALRFEEGEAILRQGLTIEPGSALLMIALADKLLLQDRVRESIDVAHHALHLSQASAVVSQALTHIARALWREGALEAAQWYFERALAIEPLSWQAVRGLGRIFQATGRLPEARQCYERVLAANPNDGETQMALGLLDLLLGRCEEGWSRIDALLLVYGSAPPVSREHVWQGEPLADRRIFVYADAGLGDCLQALRYLPLLQEMGATVVLECTQGMTRLCCRSCPGIAELQESTSPAKVFRGQMVKPPDVDCYAPMTHLESVFFRLGLPYGRPGPYLSAEPALVDRWRHRLGQDPAMKVGLCWQGSRGIFGWTVTPRVWRSLPAQLLAPLTALEGVRCYSLQKGEGQEPLAALLPHLRVEDLSAALDEQTGRFVDTAAVMMGLDLIITVDTSIAHLAGALGRPVWLMLPYVPDWRWGLEGSTTPWYPTTMRLFRQPRLGDWPAVIRSVKEELTRLVVQRHAGGELR